MHMAWPGAVHVNPKVKLDWKSKKWKLVNDGKWICCFRSLSL